MIIKKEENKDEINHENEKNDQGQDFDIYKSKTEDENSVSEFDKQIKMD